MSKNKRPVKKVCHRNGHVPGANHYCKMCGQNLRVHPYYGMSNVRLNPWVSGILLLFCMFMTGVVLP